METGKKTRKVIEISDARTGKETHERRDMTEHRRDDAMKERKDEQRDCEQKIKDTR